MATVPRVKGTQDFYPEAWALQLALRETMLAAGRAYGYQEYEGPAIEYLDLYLGKSSEEIVTQQTFRIQDRDGKALLLRPELTPTLARMIAAREQEIPLPARWQSWGQFFRYEKPQRGRGRSFFQWNVDLLGSGERACGRRGDPGGLRAVRGARAGGGRRADQAQRPRGAGGRSDR